MLSSKIADWRGDQAAHRSAVWRLDISEVDDRARTLAVMAGTRQCYTHNLVLPSSVMRLLISMGEVLRPLVFWGPLVAIAVVDDDEGEEDDAPILDCC